MSEYCILSVKKYHTFNQLKALEHHNNRDIPLPNIDKSLTPENKIIYANSDSYTDSWRNIINEEEILIGKPVPIRRNAVIALEIVTGFSRGANVNLDEWTEKNLDWISNTFGGRKNIIASTLHMDETSVHMHTEVVPINEDGRLCAKGFTDGRYAMSKLHSSYAKEMECFGLVRGERNAKSKKKDLNKFYKSVNSAVNAKLPPQEKGEEDVDYLLRMEKYCKVQKTAMEKLKLELERSETMTQTKIAQEISKYTDAISFYEDLFKASDGDEEFVKERLTSYRKLENRIPKDTLNGLVNSLLIKFESYATPLTNWTLLGRGALSDVKKKKNDSEQLVNELLAETISEVNMIDDDIETDDDNGILDI